MVLCSYPAERVIAIDSLEGAQKPSLPICIVNHHCALTPVMVNHHCYIVAKMIGLYRPSNEMLRFNVMEVHGSS